MSKIDWQLFGDMKKSSNMSVNDIFGQLKSLKTNPSLLVKLIDPVVDPMKRHYYKDSYNKNPIARLDFVSDEDGGYYVIYPPGKESPFDMKHIENVRDVFLKNNWDAFWLGDEDEYPDLVTTKFVDEYSEGLYPYQTFIGDTLDAMAKCKHPNCTSNAKI